MNKRRMIGFLALMFLLSLLRKNGIYVAGITLFGMLLFYPKNCKRILLLLITLVLLFGSYTHLLLPICGVEAGSVKEALSIPFQQTARYIRDYPQDVTLEEKNAINGVLDFEELAELYNPYISDPIKATFKEEAKRIELLQYFNVWLRQFFKHPDAYLQATIHNTYGYFYPQARIMGSFGVFEIEMDTNEDGLDFAYGIRALQPLRDLIVRGTYAIGNLPVMYWIFGPALYTWIVITVGGYFISIKKYKKLLILFPAIAIILTCVASPVNSYIRYMLPVMASTPIILAAMFGTKQIEKDNQNGENNEKEI